MKTKNSYEVFSEFYDAFIKKGFLELHKKYYSLVLKLFKKYKLNPKIILDSACGTGILMKIFKDNGWNIQGIDNSKDMLKKAKNKGLVVKKSNMINFNLKKKYDIILNFDSLGHLTTNSNLQKFFLKVSQHLNKDGLFIFDGGTKEKAENMIGKEFYYDSEDYTFIWKNSKKGKMVVVNLEILKKENDGSVKKYFETHQLRGHSIKEIESALKITKLKILMKETKPLVKEGSFIFCCQKI